ncbi:MAG: glycohydrolase toxin TNT-related protein, partial [Bacteroidetes bacterium]|nr:glycohydrolase toxin TNT-related protein [Bacteroidota bacterium]
ETVSGQSSKLYLYEPNSFKPLAVVQEKEIYHYHLDHLGTPQEITRHNGELAWSVQYKAYGNVVRKEVESIENNLRFQGQYYDAETNLHYNRHRYYDPTTARFISIDPIGLLGGNNNYEYANNPITWVDPFGLSCKELDPQPDGSPFKKDANGRWHDKKGKFVSQNWPPNDGFGTYNQKVLRKKIVLPPGKKLDRYGGWNDSDGFHDKGNFFSDTGTPFKNRALPPETIKSPYNNYEVVEPFEVESGPIAPWFGEPGGANQYLVPKSEGGIDGLLKSGKIKKVK